MTYIVTSKPKRISVAAGLVHMIVSLVKLLHLVRHNYTQTSHEMLAQHP